MNNYWNWDFCYPVYQPLIQLSTEQIIGFEALLRSTTCQSPELLFRAARSAGRLYELDTTSFMRAINTFNKADFDNPSLLIFLNVFPSTLLNPTFFDIICENLSLKSPFRRIVLEINEANEEDKMWEVPLLGQVIRELRQYGFLIALDDVGSGAASLQKIIEYEPDIVKMDRYFGKGLSRCSNKQKLISLFVDYCLGQIQLVLEGIETPEDLAAAKSLGVPIGQGFLLGSPAPLDHTILGTVPIGEP
ncbi:EAL domain-containing protein [Paenibacillus tyrfis]|uniref:EAL domain-containing protein n=1 Tax=Paenibacillus tyrfis TaxID=1501230 RepID=UPI00209EB2F6|nr:EAL domain-containing protein [Paenibacillus tyrfis]MCP1312411.1 EAL domain-containing protein [Paenibacillus tyrfis]